MDGKEIAKIEKTFLGWEDHGIFTFCLQLQYGDSGQGAGYYDLSGHHGGIEYIKRILRACGVKSWEELSGKTIFAHIKDGLVVGIENLPTERGEKFMFDDVYAEFGPK